MAPGEIWTKNNVNRVIVITSDDKLVGLTVNNQGKALLNDGMRVEDMEKQGWKYKGKARDIYQLTKP